ncbi:glycoside hydrolase family 3 C-terminal domain-containing protein [Bifidobacterium magnum]|uniref:Beta-glucosidase n=1 Tax=Bifidobacterium magnum TaxID=1692 RepID=A0A087BEN9_9BIFI|nr:glycoside hydrolase family 3 C-terminal domain-containing protein [Bifidobacterium magnum]KFI69489.1 Beta-glucosidase [Bifidobacterium magnum]
MTDNLTIGVTEANELSVKEQASLTSGQDAWHLQGIPSKGIPGYMITDGPHGLRKTTAGNGDEMNLDRSVPATCFPPAAGLSSSWNPQLVREVGEAMGEECVQEKVAVILGPGVNIKRNPLGGRNFEYWSEDPYLAGHEAAGIVDGVQSKGVGASLKHFAVNNQETDRFRVSALVSERALREIYLPAFEYIVKHSRPWTVMCSYNKINGVYSSENHWLLTDVLRKEWGFDGIVMSDWGADHNRVAALNAGLNLEMPPSGTDEQVVQGVENGTLKREQLETMAQAMIDLAHKAEDAMNQDGYRYNVDDHNNTARRAARESMVLLKNEEHVLPVKEQDHIAVIGEFARTPRYQGSGSSRINPTRLTSFLDAAQERGVSLTFAPGYTLDQSPADTQLEQEAVDAAAQADTVLMFMGLPDYDESEGFDRTTLAMPAKQLELLGKVTAANKRVVVILSNGSAVTMTPWNESVPAILETWLLGQAGGVALADIVFGDVSPSGRLAQTIPVELTDDPSTINWPGEEHHVNYGEGVFVGYRYYDTFHKPVAYPFGFGLGYADFAIDEVQVRATGVHAAQVRAKVTNLSQDTAASHVVQVYVRPVEPKVPGEASEHVARPVHELKGFAKVYLEPGQSDTVTIDLDERAFAYWSEEFHDWRIEGGEYGIEVGSSSRDIAATVPVTIAGDGKRKPLTVWNTLDEWRKDPVGKAVAGELMAKLREQGADFTGGDTSTEIFMNTLPINSLTALMGPQGNQVEDFLLGEYARRTQ